MAAAIVIGISTAPGHGAAQEPTSISGTVLDETTFTPVSGGRVLLAEVGREARTDAEGGFVLRDVPPGRFTLRVSLPGFSTAVEQIDVTDGEISFVQVFLLPLATVLDEVLVRTGRSPTDRGTLVEADGHETAISAADLLELEVPGLNMGRSGGIGAGTRMVIRGIKSFTGNNAPIVYLDGVRISQNPASGPTNDTPKMAVLDDLPASQVKRIRVLKGPSAGARFGDSANGVILIETYQGDQE